MLLIFVSKGMFGVWDPQKVVSKKWMSSGITANFDFQMIKFDNEDDEK
jgi:hypothetical protein